ncbi:MAG: ParA family protein, partial [Candidatus Marinimicrobia bacterium]|nr:ParA family protein [Candidatus Neomarinimicrobiota bacterium]
NEQLEVSGILACRVDPRTRHSREIVEELRDRYGTLVFDVEIRENVRLAEAPAAGLPITIYDSSSKGAQDYRALAKEIIAKEVSSKKPG